MTADEHADLLVSFHRKLTEGGISEDAAGALVIGLSQALLKGQIDLDPRDPKADLAEAARLKREERERQLAET